ncbi:coiled-coil domain-containing protein 115 [Alosa sapidissima]|uniref:coiled-coil domain-containing protein 115 n=1 Tax=Alosa sapidissima TaxID=34773 RepID=UPI001C08188E|nr:coiled-coil domain-containing protein 115 [Alosa sapidissima]XP_041953609.1 coiled-coil domain-containing protein 115 [Alosa sapidissima]
MGFNVKEASLHLDHKLLNLMDQLEDLEEKREKLNSLIEEGWFSLSKARYSMGNKQVSTLQYASEMIPLVRVHTKMLDSGEAEFQTQREEFQVGGGDRAGVTVEDIGPEEEGTTPRDGLRRRGHKKQNELKEEVSSGQLKETSHEPKTDHAEPQDPVKWFGILVPQNLKQAQSSFKQVIELAAEIAALQSAVVASRVELQRLVKEKQKSTTTGEAKE